MELRGTARARDETLGPEEHDDDEDQAVDPVRVLGDVEGLVPELEVRSAGPEVVVEPAADVRQPLEVEVREETRAEDDAPDVPHPAEDDHAEDEAGDLEEERVGERAAHVARVVRAGDAAE